MYLSGERICIILLAGLIIGLLPSAMLQRTSFRLIGDIAIGIVVAFFGCWLTLASLEFLATIDLPLGKSTENVSTDLAPRCNAVQPLAPLRPLLKPVIYRSRQEICDTLAVAVHGNDLPAHFFIRLLYQESNFRPGAISSVGALGIAQFMPETATERGLDNPFDPLQAIPASARLLRDLYKKFGNLGLAAAAYNAGPGRVTDWLTNKGPLPQETQDYVNAITGWPVETWKTFAQAGSPAVKLPQAAPCQETAGLLAWNGPNQIPLPPRNPRIQDLADRETIARQSSGPSTKTTPATTQAVKREQDIKGN